MGKATIAVGQTDITISRSIARETAKQFIAKTGFPNSTLIFTDSRVDSPRQLRNLFNKGAKANGIRTHYQNYVFISYSDDFTEAGLVRSKQTTNDNYLIFQDKKVGLEMRPEFAESEMKINMRFRCNNLARLNGWINSLRLSEGLQVLEFGVDIRYDYSLPAPFLSLINDSYTMQQAVEGNGETANEYVARTFAAGVQTRANLSGSHKEIIVNERQMNVPGQADDKMFYKTKEIQRGIYEVSLSYVFKYSRVIATSLWYPALIHNQFIPKKYIKYFVLKPIHFDPNTYIKPLTYVDGYLSGFPEQSYYLRGDGGSRMIEWDEFFPKDYTKQIQTIALFPIKINLNDRKEVFNLSEIPESYLPEASVPILKLFKDKINTYNESPIVIELYSVGEDETMRFIEVDATGNVRTTKDMDPTRRNYVRIGILKDFSKLHPLSTRELITHADIALPFLQLYDPSTVVTADNAYFRNTVGTAVARSNLTKPGLVTEVNLETLGLDGAIQQIEVKPGFYRNIPSILEVPEGSNTITSQSLLLWTRKQTDTSAIFANLRPQGSRQVGTIDIALMRI